MFPKLWNPFVKRVSELFFTPYNLWGTQVLTRTIFVCEKCFKMEAFGIYERLTHCKKWFIMVLHP